MMWSIKIKTDKNIANARKKRCVVAFDESIKINDSLSTSDELSQRDKLRSTYETSERVIQQASVGNRSRNLSERDH